MTSIVDQAEETYFKGLDEITKNHGQRPYVSAAFLVGSQGYGLATPESDIDVRGIYVAPTKDLLGLKSVPQCLDASSIDMQLYEVGKFMQLALKASPNALEILWAPSIYLEDNGLILRQNRQEFLSEPFVRKSYGGYASGQFRLALNAPHRKEKAFRHMFRLYEQGMDLLTTGDMTYQVKDPDRIREMAKLPDEKVEAEFKNLDRQFLAAASDLPSRANWDKMGEVLIGIRRDRWFE
jgi:hypothetical protein